MLISHYSLAQHMAQKRESWLKEILEVIYSNVLFNGTISPTAFLISCLNSSDRNL